MTVLKVKQQRSHRRRARIVAAAIAVFGNKGVHRATLTDVACRAGVPLPSIYDYFEDKTRLIAALPAATFEAFYAATDPAIAAEPDAVAKLRIFFLGTLRYMERHPAWARVFFLEIWPSTISREPQVRRAVDGFGRRVIDILQGGIAAGQLDRDNDPRLLMTILLGSMSHLVSVWLLYGRPYELSRRGDLVFERLARTIVRARQPRAAQHLSAREPKRFPLTAGRRRP